MRRTERANHPTGHNVPSCTCGVTHSLVEEAWRCRITNVAEGLWVSGESALRGSAASHEGATEARVDLVINLSEERPDHADDAQIEVVWIPAVDDGSRRTEGWFEDICEAAHGRNVLLQCHLGVARAPSAAYAVLLSRGLDECSALELVMRQRPVATATYASEAYEWFTQERANPEQVSYLELLRQRLIRENRERLNG
jgi:hypothetical protein